MDEYVFEHLFKTPETDEHKRLYGYYSRIDWQESFILVEVTPKQYSYDCMIVCTNANANEEFTEWFKETLPDYSIKPFYKPFNRFAYMVSLSLRELADMKMRFEFADLKPTDPEYARLTAKEVNRPRLRTQKQQKRDAFEKRPAWQKMNSKEWWSR